MSAMITRLTTDDFAAASADLGALLHDVVAGGASVGFVLPLPKAVVADYWRGVAADLARGTRVVLIARQGDHIIGSVQLDLPQKPNARHRTEVQKLLVHPSVRRQGLGRALMLAVEDAARAQGRTLLVLDTEQGSAAEPLYRGIGYTVAGTIPAYAAATDGALITTVIFYKHLSG